MGFSFLNPMQFKKPGLYTGVSTNRGVRSPAKGYMRKAYRMATQNQSFKPPTPSKQPTIGTPKGK